MTSVRAITLIVPGSLDSLTGGYIYDRRMVDDLRVLGWTVIVREIDASFPRPTAAARRNAARTLSAIEDDAIVVVDGLALGALPVEAEHEAARLRLVALVHHPLAAETGLDTSLATELHESERRALTSVRRVIVTSQATADSLPAYGVERTRVTVVEPGTELGPIARGSGGPGVHFLCVATLIPRKGHNVLFKALQRIAARDWRLTCVGSHDRDPETARRLRELLAEIGLTGRVRLAGEIEPPALAQYYDRADTFVLPTLHEGYGMAVAEAIARGLPVISTPAGSVAELIGDGAGLLVPPGDVDALAAALAKVTSDARLREELRAGALRARSRLTTRERAAARMAEALSHV